MWCRSLTLLIVALTGFLPPLAGQSEEEREDLVPAGFGTLRQDEITISFRQGDLLIKVTPLDESVTRLTAPDTYARLNGLAQANRASLEDQAFATEMSLFLVSFFSYEPNVTYQPEDILLVNQGLRSRPLAIQGITPGWGVQRLDQQETQIAIYAYEANIDLDVDLEVEYQFASNRGWDRILPLVESERSKARARAGGGGGPGAAAREARLTDRPSTYQGSG